MLNFRLVESQPWRDNRPSKAFPCGNILVKAGLWPQAIRNRVHAFALIALHRSTVGKHLRISLRIHHQEKEQTSPLGYPHAIGIRYYVGSGRPFCLPALFLDSPALLPGAG